MQGFNQGRYVPPDEEGLRNGNQIHKRRAAGTLKRDGTQTVRFEMPFAIWCHTCNPHAIIGQGVRFNAEKKRVGNYYSSPIWSFRMRHPACSGIIEIRTDPQNTAYVVTAGGQARDYGDADTFKRDGQDGAPILTPEERDRIREDAFANLENKAQDTNLAKDSHKRLQELFDDRGRDWEDPWQANKRVRDSFRHDRKILKRKETADEALKERLGTSIALLPASDEDARLAKLVDFMPEGSGKAVVGRSVFQTPRATSSLAKRTKSSKESRKEALRRQLVSNTKAALNPFGV